jgi:hypothetical protein
MMIGQVIHDEYLQHLFEANGHVSSFSCKQLKQFTYRRKTTINSKSKLDLYKTERMPTLEEIIQFLEPTKLKLMIEIKERIRYKEMSRSIHRLYQKYPFLYSRSYCASFQPLNLYEIRLLNPHIITGFLFVHDLTTHLIRNADQLGKKVPIYIKYNLPLRYFIDRALLWLGSPAGLKLLGCNLVCMEQHEVSALTLEQYHKNDIIVAVWVVNTAEQKSWLKNIGATIITDYQFS